MIRNWRAIVDRRMAEGFHLWVGLDTDPERVPEHMKLEDVRNTIFYFNLAIVRATAPFAAAFKINRSYAQGAGEEGEDALRRTIEMLHANYPGHGVIVDGKQGDIDRSAAMAARGVFLKDRADATTVNPFMGEDAVLPFLDKAYAGRGVFVLCRTSNPSAGRYQDGFRDEAGMTLAERIALDVEERLNPHGATGLVVGATLEPAAIARLRALAPNVDFLFPGVGRQGGGVEGAVRAARGSGKGRFLIGAASSIAGASMERDFAHAAAREAERLHRAITACG